MHKSRMKLTWMTKVTPIGPTEDHVEAEDRNSGGVVVLVEDPLLFVVDEVVALCPVSDSNRKGIMAKRRSNSLGQNPSRPRDRKNRPGTREWCTASMGSDSH